MFFLIRHLTDDKKGIFQKSLNKVEITIKRDGSTWFEVVLLLCLCWLPQNISESAGAVLFHSQKNLIAKRSKNLNTLTFFGRLNRNIKKGPWIRFVVLGPHLEVHHRIRVMKREKIKTCVKSYVARYILIYELHILSIMYILKPNVFI